MSGFLHMYIYIYIYIYIEIYIERDGCHDQSHVPKGSAMHVYLHTHIHIPLGTYEDART